MQPNAAQATFWQWFHTNGERLRAAMYGQDEAAREAASVELREAADAVEEGLVLEFGPAAEGGPRPLIVSADGRPERVDAVKDFVAAAPALPGWEVVAFRPRMEVGDSVEIALQDERIGAADVWFRVTEDDDGLDLTLYVRGLTPANERLRGLGASLLAQHAVGERDALTLLTGLQVEALPQGPPSKGPRPFRELAVVFDAAKERKYPPPGRLALDPQGWQVMRGTLSGSPAVILFNAGLRPLVGHPDYDCRLTVTIPLNETDDDGMPATEEEYLAVSELGDRLGEALQQGQASLHALTLTTQGRRELVFYTADADAALRRLAPLRTKATTHRVETAVERDSFWGAYRGFCDSGEPGEAEE